MRETDPAGRGRAMLSVRPDGTPALNQVERDGSERDTMTIEGGGGLALADKSGRVVWTAP